MKFLLLLLASLLVASQPIESASFESTYSSSLEYAAFTYAPNPSPTYANSNQKANTTAYYAPHYTELSHLVGDLSSTTWGTYNPNDTATATDSENPYGDYAYSQLWSLASLQNYTYFGLYSTTVEPTAVPTESLVLPPPDAFKFDDSLKFPEDLHFGVAGSAAQIEGAITYGKGPTIQDKLIPDARPKDYVTNENYFLYKQDIVRLAAMGVKTYSFSIPWARILPFTLPGTPVNQEALDHYDDLINTCLENGITPMATLTHFDSPYGFVEGTNFTAKSALFKNGGYSSSYKNVSFEDAFVHYGKIILTHYADRVPLWVGFNEPLLYSNDPASIKTVVKSTARLHKFYHEEIQGKGKFGIKFNLSLGVPRNTSNPEDVAAADRYNAFYVQSFGNPLFLGEDYPQAWKDTFANYSNFLFTEDELKEVKGGSDFVGVDPYTYGSIVAPKEGIEACQNDPDHKLWPFCANVTQVREDNWKIGYRSQSYVYITPNQIRENLNYLWKTFKTPVAVTEIGFPEWREGEKELGDQLYDLGRSVYYRSYFDAILKAIHEDGVKVDIVTMWSFADNWEFGDYEQQFGLQVVNRTTQERYYKKSFFDSIKYYEERS
ncbi:glycoside hydrolase [Hyphopichia burtonii NRRL Y-1933]|uniref:Glycoside hydrolase n=1 Tax=Hyphopichia burtonii NRRL Y-1933 TaxID=984485 RepID=A0A1E4RHM2_9ASCO|nr:glycoside hydrolase [Hyphopichia burtonii NRRL Y-1933]ODV66764.1 glycoside hydrolase [Hyphopichia burtonii NRRL Y-1933]